jgi:hypothetical protein
MILTPAPPPPSSAALEVVESHKNNITRISPSSIPRIYEWESQRRQSDLARHQIPSWIVDYMQWHNQQRSQWDHNRTNRSGEHHHDDVDSDEEEDKENNYHSAHYLVLRCLDPSIDHHCGGLSDRLKPIPLLIRLAAQSHRMFFIHWTHPTLLTNFLIPPRRSHDHCHSMYHRNHISLSSSSSINSTTTMKATATAATSSCEEEHYLDWTAPSWLVSKLDGHDSTDSRLYTRIPSLVKGVFRNDTRLVLARLQDQHGGSSIYNMLEASRSSLSTYFNLTSTTTTTTTITTTTTTTPLKNVENNNSSSTTTTTSLPRAYRSVYGVLFRLLFTPSFEVAKRIDSAMQQVHLVPDQYVATHLRTQYGRHPLLDAQIRAVSGNAVQCASTLFTSSNQTTIIFLSDSVLARKYIQHSYIPPTKRTQNHHHLHIRDRRNERIGTIVSENRNNATWNTYQHHNHRFHVNVSSKPLVAALPVTLNEPSIAIHLDDTSSVMKTMMMLESPQIIIDQYYPIFVDMFLMSYASAVAHAQGGFGRLGVLLSYNPHHFISYFTGGQWVYCHWHDPP